MVKAIKLTKPSEGYFLAKREMQDKLDARAAALRQKLNAARAKGNYASSLPILLELDVIESFRDAVRNGMLWDTRKGS